MVFQKKIKKKKKRIVWSFFFQWISRIISGKYLTVSHQNKTSKAESALGSKRIFHFFGFDLHTSIIGFCCFCLLLSKFPSPVFCVFISQYCWTCKLGVGSCNSSASFISCTSHCVTGKYLEKTAYALHYLNIAVSEYMHPQHEGFVPYTFFYYLINLCAYTWRNWLLCLENLVFLVHSFTSKVVPSV